MEAIHAGIFSIVPPVLAIILALLTKDVVFSLLMGILSGTIIYTILAGLNPLVAPVEVLFNTSFANLDLYIIFFVFLLGALVQVISLSGGSAAYGRWGSRYLRSRRSTLLATAGLGCLIFVDDYFNCLTVGTVMKPLTDRQKISRAKLAYLIDSTAAPVCIIAPISSWAGAVGSSLRATGSFASDFSAFCATIPYNLYALLTLLMIVFLIFTGWDFGPMRKQEEMSAASTAPDDTARQAESPCKSGTMTDMVLPIVLLIVLAMLGMLYNGGFWAAGEPGYHSLTGALNNCTAAQALCWGGFGAVLFAFLLYVPRGLITFKEFMACVTEGFKNMIPSNSILVLAWTISGLCRDQLLTAEFVRDAMTRSQIPGALLPAIIFVVAAFLSFSIGSSWGTFGILIPIIVPVATALSPNLLIVSLSATLGGSIFGDHCSPISDTTILSSTGAGCDHLTHVATQMPYALLVAGCCLFGYLVAGFSDGNLLLMFGATLAALISLITIMHFSCQKHAVSLPKEI